MTESQDPRPVSHDPETPVQGPEKQSGSSFTCRKALYVSMPAANRLTWECGCGARYPRRQLAKICAAVTGCGGGA